MWSQTFVHMESQQPKPSSFFGAAKARAYILEHEELPPEYDLLIFNAAYETSINLRGHFDFMIIHHSSSDTITQARGRYRNDLDTLYLLD